MSPVRSGAGALEHAFKGTRVRVFARISSVAMVLPRQDRSGNPDELRLTGMPVNSPIPMTRERSNGKLFFM